MLLRRHDRSLGRALNAACTRDVAGTKPGSELDAERSVAQRHREPISTPPRRQRGITARSGNTTQYRRHQSPQLRLRHAGHRRSADTWRITDVCDGWTGPGCRRRTDREDARRHSEDPAGLDRTALDRRRKSQLSAGRRVHGDARAERRVSARRHGADIRQTRCVRSVRCRCCNNAWCVFHERREAVRRRRVELATARGQDR